MVDRYDVMMIENGEVVGFDSTDDTETLLIMLELILHDIQFASWEVSIESYFE